LITQNTGNQAFEITQALHTYFKVGDIKQVSVQGLDGCPYLDKVDGGAEKQQTGEITISEEVDRVYTNVPARLVIDDAALGRQIQIQSTGSKTAIVWNPWSEISAKMADLGDQDYERFVCVETANAADDIITVKPGETVQLTAQYSIEP
jgi:glucose-6-phosphate 1-epimerase